MAIYFFLMIALEYNLDYIDLIDENYFSNKCKKKKTKNFISFNKKIF